MSDIIVGVMWNRNEGDLLPHTIPMALKAVDCLMIVDDDSDDNSWDIIKSFDKKLEYSVRRSDKIDDTPYSETVFARQHLLDEVRKRFGTKDVWVQVIESDSAVLDTDIHDAIQRCAIDDISVKWHMINACRREWCPKYNLPRIPNEISLYDFYDSAHWMEQVTYTFRPLSELLYTERVTPWPQGFSHYSKSNFSPKLIKSEDSPLIAHWGWRSPIYHYSRVKKAGRTLYPKYPSWDLSSPETIKNTVPFFNGEYNNSDLTFEPISRKGWQSWLFTREKIARRIPNVNSLADLIDRLTVEINKLAYYENKKREEHTKEDPDYELIAKCDNLSRNCCELRSALKNEINKLMEEIVKSGIYKVMKEPRTFRSSPTKISDVLEEMCEERSRSLYNGELIEAIKYDFSYNKGT